MQEITSQQFKERLPEILKILNDLFINEKVMCSEGVVTVIQTDEIGFRFETDTHILFDASFLPAKYLAFDIQVSVGEIESGVRFIEDFKHSKRGF